MFKKKTPEIDKKPEPTENLSTYHSVLEIETAIDTLYNAFNSGQLPNKGYQSPMHKSYLVFAEQFYDPRNSNTEEHPPHILNSQHSLKIIRKQDIVTSEAVIKEKTLKKQEELNALKQKMTTTLKDIEKLARELGETQ